jgi:hypothetical protein
LVESIVFLFLSLSPYAYVHVHSHIQVLTISHAVKWDEQVHTALAEFHFISVFFGFILFIDYKNQ